MKLLLDTHAFLWWIADDPSLSTRARRAIAGAANEVYLSAASAHEMAIKAGLGRLRLREPLEELVPREVAACGFRVLPVQLSHALGVSSLPPIHRDPFDRLLVAQARIEDLALVTIDKALGRYGVKIVW